MKLDYSRIYQVIRSHKFRVYDNHWKKYYNVSNLSLTQQDHVLTCIEQACRSDMTNKHGAVVVKYDQVVSRGYNYDYGQMIYHGHYSVHAEVNVILNCKHQKVDTSEIDIYVIRLKTYRGEIIGLHNSAPCSNCMRMSTEFAKARRIYFS